MVQKHRLWDSYELRSFPAHARSKIARTTSKPFQGKLWKIKVNTPFGERRYMPISDIDTIQKIAGEVRKNYGFGTFNVLFFNPNMPNKKHLKNFRCIGMNCKWYGSCRLKHRDFKHLSCRRNSKYKANWVVRLRLAIIPMNGRDNDIDYSIKVLYNKMYYLKWWKK